MSGFSAHAIRVPGIRAPGPYAMAQYFAVPEFVCFSCVKDSRWVLCARADLSLSRGLPFLSPFSQRDSTRLTRKTKRGKVTKPHLFSYFLLHCLGPGDLELTGFHFRIYSLLSYFTPAQRTAI